MLLAKNIYDSDSEDYCTTHKKVFKPSNPSGALIQKLSPPIHEIVGCFSTTVSAGNCPPW